MRYFKNYLKIIVSSKFLFYLEKVGRGQAGDGEGGASDILWFNTIPLSAQIFTGSVYSLLHGCVLFWESS